MTRPRTLHTGRVRMAALLCLLGAAVLVPTGTASAQAAAPPTTSFGVLRLATAAPGPAGRPATVQNLRINTARVTTAASTGWVTRSGNHLQLGGAAFRFAGVNEYWLGLDDNLRDANGNPSYPTRARIDNGLSAAASVGATVVRAHSVGISVGCPVCIEPALGRFNDAAFASADYAVYRAGALGLRMMIPLVDQWRFYHGGESVFTGWRGYPNAADPGVTAANSTAQRNSEAHFYTDPAVVNDFRAYVAHVLNHVNVYTGVAYKNDPTIMAWETGNELWTAPTSWTDSLARYLKNSLGARALVADGSAADGMPVARAAIDSPSVDIVGGHFYPVDVDTARSDAAVAASHGKAYVIGEYAWTDLGASASQLTAVQADADISGDLVWTLMPYQENGVPEPHGDGYALYNPATTSSMQAFLGMLTNHAAAMAGH